MADKAKVALISLYSRQLAFGVRYLSTALKARGHRCDLLFFKRMITSPDPTLCLELTPNANFCKPASRRETGILIEVLRDLKPDLIGLSVMSPFYRIATEITGIIKRELSVPVVWGGVHPTISPADSIMHADIVCIGEGEDAILDLARAVSRGEDLHHIPNLWVKTKDGRITKNDVRSLVTDLDSLGYPDQADDEFKHYIDADTYTTTRPEEREHVGKTVDLMTSRGCPFQCSYCCGHILQGIYKGKGPYVRRRSVSSIITEILAAPSINEDLEQIHFWDDVFTFDKRWIEEFSHAYREKIGIPFSCYAHPRYTDREILSLLKEAGMQCANMGIQSGSSRISHDIYSRQYDADQILIAAKQLQELAIHPWYDLIVDNPYETDEDHHETLELLLELPPPFQLNIHSLCYFPRTTLTTRALRDGLISDEEIEGANTKGIDQFRMSLDRKRDALNQFWNLLFGMTRHQIFPRRLIRFCSRSRFLRRFPSILKFLVVNVLRLILLSRSRFPAWRAKKELLVFELTRSTGANRNILNISITNQTPTERKALFALRAYPVREPAHPGRYLGAWNWSSTIPLQRSCVVIDLSFPDAKMSVGDEVLPPTEQWIGTIREAGLYRIEVILYGEEQKVIHQKMLTWHSSILFDDERNSGRENEN